MQPDALLSRRKVTNDTFFWNRNHVSVVIFAGCRIKRIATDRNSHLARASTPKNSFVGAEECSEIYMVV